MNYKSILFFLGIYSLFISFFSILNIFYSIYFNFILGLNSYLTTLIISLFLGSLFCYIGHHHSKNISLSDQIAFILLSFVFISAISFAFPRIDADAIPKQTDKIKNV